jgi:hypothetical protein
MFFKHRAQYEGEDQGGGFIGKFFHYKTDDSEKDHHPDIEDRIADAVTSQQAE